MKATTSRQPSSVASGILKLVGLIMIVSSLLEYLIFVFPPSNLANANPQQQQLNWIQWQQTVTSQIIDRGIIPMVGLAFIFAAFWIDSSFNANGGRKGVLDLLKPFSLLLSVLLGLLFLLPIPILNFNSLRLLNQRANEVINQRAEQAETQIKDRSSQVAALAQDQQRLTELDQAISSGRVQGAQLEQLRTIKDQLQQFKQDPKALNQRVEAAQTQVRTDKQQAVKQTKEEFLKSSLRSVVSSLLLGVGYLGIAWMALTGLLGGSVKPPRR
jgi:ABC-type multidrug transport system fused ATPase/permease subunit